MVTGPFSPDDHAGGNGRLRVPMAQRSAVIVLVAAFLGACTPDAPPEPPIFVRGGLLHKSEDGGIPLGRYRFSATPWRPGQVVTLDGSPYTAPTRPDCVSLYEVDLGDVRRWIAQGGEGPDTAIAFDPSGERLAVGTFLGELIVLQAQSGQVLLRKKLAETMVKSVAWSKDGAVLYAGEQSPDAWIHAFSGSDFSTLWSRRLADDLGEGKLADGLDVYGAYTLPAAYTIWPLDGGALIVAGTHGWAEPDGSRVARTRLYRLGRDGKTEAAWPEAGPEAASTFHPRVDEQGGVVLAALSRPDEAGGGPARLLLLDLTTMKERLRLEVPPLEPHFRHAFLWESADVEVAEGTVVAGLGDGRIRWVNLRGEMMAELHLGTPQDEGGVPIAASVGFSRLRKGTTYSVTSGTTIPWGAAPPETRPPALHHSENSLWAHSVAGDLIWTFQSDHRLNGLQVGGDGHTLLIGAGPRTADRREDLFGTLLFELDGEGSGLDRWQTTCASEGPIFFRPAMSAQGLVAMAEFPFQREDGSFGAAYRLRVSR